MQAKTDHLMTCSRKHNFAFCIPNQSRPVTFTCAAQRGLSAQCQYMADSGTEVLLALMRGTDAAVTTLPFRLPICPGYGQVCSNTRLRSGVTPNTNSVTEQGQARSPRSSGSHNLISAPISFKGKILVSQQRYEIQSQSNPTCKLNGCNQGSSIWKKNKTSNKRKCNFSNSRMK